MIDWSNPDPDPSDLDPSNPAPGAGLTGSIGSKCDLCAYMASKNHFCTHCRTCSGLLLTFCTTHARARSVRLLPFWVTCKRHFLLRQHGNRQGPKKSVRLILKDPTDLRFGSGSGSDQTIIAFSNRLHSIVETGSRSPPTRSLRSDGYNRMCTKFHAKAIIRQLIVKPETN